MIAIVGLGNPEEIHFRNRHNVGFMAVDNIVDNFKLGAYKTKFQCKIITSKINDIPVILLKPLNPPILPNKRLFAFEKSTISSLAS